MKKRTRESIGKPRPNFIEMWHKKLSGPKGIYDDFPPTPKGRLDFGRDLSLKITLKKDWKNQPYAISVDQDIPDRLLPSRACFRLPDYAKILNFNREKFNYKSNFCGLKNRE